MMVRVFLDRMSPEEERIVQPLLALSDSREIRAYLAQPMTGVYIVRRDGSHDGEVVWASPSLRDILGYAPAEVVGRNAWDVFLAPEDVTPAADYSARMSDGDLVGWAPLLCADRSKRWVRFDALNRAGGIVIALRPESDPREQRFHSHGRPIPS
jgi:PAS domain S-box-containing protein